MRPLPLIQPNPPRLSTMGDDLRGIEERAIYSNGGPVVTAFERDATDRLFGGRGASLAVSNATLGLMLALRHGIGARAGRGHYALVPALTFAATAQAAVWAGLVPLIHDVDPETWVSDPQVEEALLRRHGGQIAALVPYATFGRSIDLDRYQWLARRHDVTVVVDAAASLGSQTADGLNFGAGAGLAVVYSMHATKTFATGEGGLVHSGDVALIAALRRMANFGFDDARSAEMPGLNAKMSEVAGLLAGAKLADIDRIASHRAHLAACYRAELPEFVGQAVDDGRQCFQFWSALLPAAVASQRAGVIAALGAAGIGAGHYFSPHLGQQPYFRATALIEPTPVADAVTARILSLPITDAMTDADVRHVAAQLRAAVAGQSLVRNPAATPKPAQTVHAAVIIGGGPAGTALLTAAAKQGTLAALAGSGLVMVERDRALGRGNLGNYAIRSDTTAETFLSAIRDNPAAELAALVDHPAALGVARHIGAPGAPLIEAGELLAVTGERLGAIVGEHGGTVLRGHETLSARQTADGLWATTVVASDGSQRDLLSRHIVIATGGHMCAETVRQAAIAGATLGDLAGDRLITADAVMRSGGMDSVQARLADVRAPRIAVIGGSTSAMATVVHLLKASPALPLGAGAITLLHRRPLRPFYPSRAAALADGFTDFTDDDICPVSGFVYRLAGFRLESRDLVMRALAIGGREPDPRLALFRLDQHDHAATRACLARADLVISATGYRPHALPLFDAAGAPIALACNAAKPGPMVDRHCRVRDAAGGVVDGAFGIGLAAGFVPWGPLGGEASFRGNANGLWLWQNAVGQMIVDQISGAALVDEAAVDAAPPGRQAAA
ncbi:DegT/DnrJ/EryC1/StrS family aminotransferase [Novosphingobium sp.]|uniref:DegT/DnrJ/EryC1/StrS family aminotransferase n=1 Tax=Novosphingobium sp. TaxID=1874826 RepID=UPI0033406773